MGIESRDYVRDERPNYGYAPTASSGLWAVKYILIINVAMFFLQTATKDPNSPPGHMRGGVTEWLSLSLMDTPDNPDRLQVYQIWRFVTYGFCHGNFQHILFNMFVFWMFGRILEPIYGSREFLLFFLGGVVVSGMFHIGVQAATGGAGVVGASGGVMAVVFLTAAVFPRMTVLVMFVIPAQLRFVAIAYAAIDIFGALNPGVSNIAHFAHLGGAAFGLAYKHFEWRLSGLWDSVSSRFSGGKGSRTKKRSRAKVKIYRPSEPSTADLKDEVDKILVKIHEKGEASLTDKERKTLVDASRRFKKPGD